MTAEVVARWRKWLPELQEFCVRSKNAQLVPFELAKEYSSLSPEERADLEPLLEEWALSDVPLERSASLSLVDDHGLTKLIPTLRVLQERLEHSTEIGAEYEWANVNRILGRLAAAVAGASDFPPDERSSVVRRGPEWGSGDVARQWRAWFASLYRNPTRWRSAPRVLTRASRAYGSMTADERLEIEPVLRGWLLSEDHTERLAALTLAAEHQVTSLIPALAQLELTLNGETGVEETAQRELVGEVLRRLHAIAAGGPTHMVSDPVRERRDHG